VASAVAEDTALRIAASYAATSLVAAGTAPACGSTDGAACAANPARVTETPNAPAGSSRERSVNKER
jgi:hypothetical protein